MSNTTANTTTNTTLKWTCTYDGPKGAPAEWTKAQFAHCCKLTNGTMNADNSKCVFNGTFNNYSDTNRIEGCFSASHDSQLGLWSCSADNGGPWCEGQLGARTCIYGSSTPVASATSAGVRVGVKAAGLMLVVVIALAVVS